MHVCACVYVCTRARRWGRWVQERGGDRERWGMESESGQGGGKGAAGKVGRRQDNRRRLWVTLCLLG